MIKVSFHEIAEGSTLHFAIIAGGKPLAVFQGKDKKSYKKYFGLKGVDVMRLNGSEANDLAGLRVQMAKDEKPFEKQDSLLPKEAKPLKTEHAEFAGDDYQPERDKARLTGQIKRVYDAMKDGQERTLDHLHQITNDPHASISAQLRHLRKSQFGGHDIRKKHLGDGLYTYFMVI